MKYNLEGTTFNLQYERKDEIWKNYLDRIGLNPSSPQHIQQLSRKRDEDAGPEVVELSIEVLVMRSLPNRLPRHERGAPINPFSYDTITVWYEPDPTVNFDGKWYTIHNNRRSKPELITAFQRGEDVIDDISLG